MRGKVLLNIFKICVPIVICFSYWLNEVLFVLLTWSLADIHCHVSFRYSNIMTQHLHTLQNDATVVTPVTIYLCTKSLQYYFGLYSLCCILHTPWLFKTRRFNLENPSEWLEGSNWRTQEFLGRTLYAINLTQNPHCISGLELWKSKWHSSRKPLNYFWLTPVLCDCAGSISCSLGNYYNSKILQCLCLACFCPECISTFPTRFFYVCPTSDLFVLTLFVNTVSLISETFLQEKEWVWLEDQNTHKILKFYILLFSSKNMRKIHLKGISNFLKSF